LSWPSPVCEVSEERPLAADEVQLTLNGRANLLRTRSDSKHGLSLDAVVNGILSNGSRAAHILVRRVGARANQAYFQFLWPLVRLNGFLEFADWCGKIRSEWAVDVWLQCIEVNLDEFVVLGAFVFMKFCCIGAREVTDFPALRCTK
jgi:hypothetical protein